MHEQLISFETAKLAKEKGFEELVSNCYYKEELFGTYAIMDENDSAFIDVMDGNELENHNHIDFIDRYSAPTQSLLQKWLREKHKIIVSINIMSDLSYYSLLIDINKDKLALNNQSKNKSFIKYEECLEDGLFEALKLI